MPAKIYKVTLEKDEREELAALVNKGKGNARRMRRARILLMADEAQENGGWKDADIAKALSASVRTVERTRQKCVEAGIEAAIAKLVLRDLMERQEEEEEPPDRPEEQGASEALWTEPLHNDGGASILHLGLTFDF